MTCVSPFSSLCSPWETSSRGSAPHLLASPRLLAVPSRWVLGSFSSSDSNAQMAQVHKAKTEAE